MRKQGLYQASGYRGGLDGDNTERGIKGYTVQGAPEGGGMVTIQCAEAKVIPDKESQRGEERRQYIGREQKPYQTKGLQRVEDW